MRLRSPGPGQRATSSARRRAPAAPAATACWCVTTTTTRSGPNSAVAAGADAFEDRLGVEFVEVLGGLVEQDDRRRVEQSARQQQTAALTAGEGGTTAGEVGVQPVGQRIDPVAEADVAERRADLRVGGITARDQ